MTFTFNPPTQALQFTGLIHQWRTDQGVSVWRYNGTWYQSSEPFWGNETSIGIKDADVVAKADRPGGERTDNTDRDRYLFLGGRVYTISAAVAATLVAAGYAPTEGVPSEGGTFRWDSFHWDDGHVWG